MHGEVNAVVELTAGLHYIDTTTRRSPSNRWRSLAGGPRLTPEPSHPFRRYSLLLPHEGVGQYESPKGPLLRFEPAIVDSSWPAARHEGQYTRAVFKVGASPALPAGTTYEWDFGDGIKATGTEADHVYLLTGTYRSR